MPGLKHLISAAVGLAALLSTAPAAATPVVAGTPVVFNFQAAQPGTFTSFSSSYGIVLCSVFEDYASQGCHGQAQPDSGTITLFDGLNGNGNGSVVGTWTDLSFSSGNGGRASGNFAAVADGIFSLVYSGSIGAIDVNTPSFYLDNAQGSVRIDGVLVAAVPEPESIALLGIGSLAAAGAAGGRRVARRRSAAT